MQQNPEINDLMQKDIEACVKFNDYLAAKGIPLLLLTIPDKERIFPEYYPSSILNTDNPPLLEFLTGQLQKETNLKVLNLTQTLLANKTEDDLLYYRLYDPTHWNNYGAYVGYREILKLLDSLVPLAEKPEDGDYIIEKKSIYRNIRLTQSTVYTIPYPDTFYSITSKTAPSYKILPPDTLFSLDMYPEHVRNTTFYYRNATKQALPKLLIIGDSYIYSAMLPFLADAYGEVLFIPQFGGGDFTCEALQWFDPDIVLLEAVERAYFYGFFYTILFYLPCY